jgi:cyanoexosortase B-associated protein
LANGKTRGTRKWSLQTIQKEGSNTQAILLILPQNGPKDQPQVEWMEVDSFWHWKVAQERTADFIVKVPDANANTDMKVQARFFRGSTKQQTFAVLQWYAWSKGGNPSQLRWFLADQSAQWHKQRAAWAAVSLMIPIEPLGQVEKSWEQAKALGETVQSRLLSGIL